MIYEVLCQLHSTICGNLPRTLALISTILVYIIMLLLCSFALMRMLILCYFKVI